MDAELTRRIEAMRGKQVFFIAATEKSGTTWLQIMLDAHPEAACRGEGQFGTKLEPLLAQAFREYSEFIDGLNKKVFGETTGFPLLDEGKLLYLEQTAATLLLGEYGADPEIKAVGEKTPGNIRTLARLRTLFPKARFVFIVRDGRDVVVSGHSHIARQHGAAAGEETLENYARRTAKVWRNDFQRAREFIAKHPADCITVRYEDLHADPAPQLRGILEFLGIDSSDATITACIEAGRFENLAGGRKRGDANDGSQFRKGIVGDWRNRFDPKVTAVFEEEAGELLRELGYEAVVTPPAAPSRPTQSKRADEVTAVTVKPVPADAAVQARQAFDAGDLDRALELARTAQRAKSQAAEGFAVEGMVLQLRGRRKLAAQAFGKAVAAAPKRADIWLALGNCQRDMGDRMAANHSLRRALDADPKLERARYMLAVVVQELGHKQEAAVLYADYLKRNPEDRLAWSLYGTALRDAARYDEAVQALQRARDLDPADIPTRNALVMTYYMMDDAARGVEEGAEVLRMKDEKGFSAFAKSGIDAVLTPRQAPFDPMSPARNVIAFSLWGDDPVYTHGAIVNAQIAPNVYPGWRCRFYCDQTVPQPIRAELRRLGSEIRMVNEPDLLALKPLWRFLASDDAAVDRFICRDADSRLNIQEAVAVDDWIKSGKPFHIMRDHIYHMEVILAGMWGGVAGVLPNLRQLATAGAYAVNKWSDQEFLRDVVWPLIKGQARTHDSVYSYADAVDFPIYGRLPGKIHVGGAIKSMPPWRGGGA